MHHPSPALRSLPLLLTALLALPSVAHAGGAIVRDGTGAAGLTDVVDLDLVLLMDDAETRVEDARNYEIPWDLAQLGAAFADTQSASVALTVYHDLPPGPDVELHEVMIDGVSQGALYHEVAEADALRRELAEELHDPAPLAGWGTPMLVIGPMEVVEGSWSPRITLRCDVPHSPRGTLKGLELPADWSRSTKGSSSLFVEATTEAPLRALFAPFDGLKLVRQDAHTVTGSVTTWSRDASLPTEVLLSTGDEPIRLDVLPFRYGPEEGGFVAALLSATPEPSDEDVQPRDIVIALDRSGSMEGEKIQQAQEALVAVLEGLRPQDHVAVVTYAATAITATEEAVAATAATIEELSDFVDATVADGGTNIGAALELGFDTLPQTVGHPRYVVLITDGLPTEGAQSTEALLDIARAHEELGARIFTFGVGWDVNTVLLDQLAKETGGEATYIMPGSSVALAIESFFERVASPVLASPTLDLSAFGAFDAYPAELPDLYAGQTALVVARYASPGAAYAALEGLRDGGVESHWYELELPKLALAEGWAPRLWATRHVGHVLHDLKLGLVGDEVVPGVLEVAGRWGIETDFTKFAVDEEGDSEMSYSAVPLDTAGSKAVETSASLDGESRADSYGGGGGDAGVPGADGQPMQARVRYAWDRTLPLQDDAYTDTSLPESPSWTDLHLFSEAWWELVEDEAELDVHAFLSLGTQVRFEHFGRHFRVTDAVALDPEDPEAELPPESGDIPGTEPWRPEPRVTAGVGYLGDSPPPGLDMPDLETDEPAVSEPAGGCSGAGTTSAVPSLLLALALALGFTARARRREQAD